MERAADRVQLKCGWNHGSRHELDAKTVVLDLGERLIQLRLLLLADGHRLGSVDHADDAIGNFQIPSPEEDSSDRLPVGEIAGHEGPVYNNDLLVLVRVGKCAALANRNVHRTEECGSDGVPCETRVH